MPQRAPAPALAKRRKGGYASARRDGLRVAAAAGGLLFARWATQLLIQRSAIAFPAWMEFETDATVLAGFRITDRIGNEACTVALIRASHGVTTVIRFVSGSLLIGCAGN